MADELDYGYLMPFFPFIPAIAIIMQIVLAVFIIDVSYIAWIIAPTWVGVGLVIYFAYSRTRALPIREEILTLERAYAPERERYLVLVPVEDIRRRPGDCSQGNGPDKGKERCCGTGTHGIHSGSSPLSDASRFTLPGKEVIAEATSLPVLSFLH